MFLARLLPFFVDLFAALLDRSTRSAFGGAAFGRGVVPLPGLYLRNHSSYSGVPLLFFSCRYFSAFSSRSLLIDLIDAVLQFLADVEMAQLAPHALAVFLPFVKVYG